MDYNNYNFIGEQISQKDALKASYESCIKIYNQPPRKEGFNALYGEEAYKILINKLEKPTKRTLTVS